MNWTVTTSLLGALGVAAAAWSSHGLAHWVSAEALPIALERARIANFHHMVHTVVLLVLTVWMRQQPQNTRLKWAGWFFSVGILAFSGGIYGIRLIAGIDHGPLLMVVPGGGMCLICGWLLLGWAGLRHPV
jgi:uncharacterized membrane protein YgdD (TMEM256/DUF423 family)